LGKQLSIDPAKKIYLLSKKRLYLFSLVIQALAFLIAFVAEDWTWAVLMSIVLGCTALAGPE